MKCENCHHWKRISTEVGGWGNCKSEQTRRDIKDGSLMAAGNIRPKTRNWFGCIHWTRCFGVEGNVSDRFRARQR